MTPARRTGNAPEFEADEWGCPGFGISWAGEGPRDNHICIGSEDGRVGFIDYGGENIAQTPPLLTVADSRESINGAAFMGGVMAVSTRSEIVCWKDPGQRGKAEKLAEYNGGAHGVTATSSGGFVAPLGAYGLLSLNPRHDGFQAVSAKSLGKAFVFYKIVKLNSIDHGDLFACALRGSGLALVVHNEQVQSVSVISPPTSDVVDVCSLSNSHNPFAAVALGIDGSLHLIRDALHGRGATTLRFKGLGGTAYRVLNSQGNLFILTNSKLYMFLGLSDRLLGGRNKPQSVPLVSTPIEAVDANLAFDRWLLLVTPDGNLSVFEVEKFAAFSGRPPTSAILSESGWDTLPQEAPVYATAILS